MTYKNFEKKDNFPKILIEETDFLLFVTMVSSLIISIVITFWLRNRILFSGIYKFLANNKVPDILASIFAYVLTGCIIFMVLILSLIIAIVVLLKLITFFRKTYSKLSHACMLNRICHLPFTVEEMEKYRTAGLGELLLLVLKMETYKEYDGHKLRPVLSEMHLIREKNEQLYENIKIVFREDFDDNGFLKKDTRNEVYTLLCEKTDISEISITIFLDRLNAGKDL